MKNTQQNKQQIKNIMAIIKGEITRHKESGNSYPYFRNKLGKWSQGFEIVALDNNKPSTIQAKANPNKRNLLVIFRMQKDMHDNYGYYGRYLGLCEWDTTKAKAKGLNTSSGSRRKQYLYNIYTNQDAESMRKSASIIFLVVVPYLINEEDEEKHNQRRATWRNLNTQERAKDLASEMVEVEPTEEEKRQGAFLVYRSRGWYSNTREMVDKSYYNITSARHVLKHRARELHAQRMKANWLATDHTQKVEELRTIEQEESEQIVSILKAKKYDFYAREIITSLMESIDYIESTIEKIQKGEITSMETLNERTKKIYLDLKKCRLIATHQGNHKLYGWSWWEDDPKSGGLVNSYKVNDDPKNEYFHYIDAVGNMTY